MALEKYRMKNYSPTPKTGRQPEPETYQEKLTQIHGVKIRISSQNINFQTLHGSQVLDDLRAYFSKKSFLSLEQCHDLNRFSIPEGTWFRQYLLILEETDKIENALKDARKIAQEQDQSGAVREYYYSHTLIHIFKSDPQKRKEWGKYTNSRLNIVFHDQAFEAKEPTYAKLLEASLRHIFETQYLCIQESISLDIPSELASITADLDRNGEHPLIKRMVSGFFNKNQKILHLEQGGKPLLVTSWPEEHKLNYWGDSLPPEHLDKLVELLKLPTPIQMVGWFYYETIPEQFYKLSNTIHFPAELGQTPDASVYYQIIGQIMALGQSPEIIPIIFKNDRALLLILNPVMKNWLIF